jgi:hypothetical protein
MRLFGYGGAYRFRRMWFRFLHPMAVWIYPHLEIGKSVKVISFPDPNMVGQSAVVTRFRDEAPWNPFLTCVQTPRGFLLPVYPREIQIND